MFFNMAFLIELSLLIGFAGLCYGAGATLAPRFQVERLPRHLLLLVAGVIGILLGLLLSWLSHSVLLVVFPNDRPLIQTGDLVNMGLLAIAAYLGMHGSRAGAA